MGCPVFIRVAPELTNIDFPGIEPCAIGSIVEVLVNIDTYLSSIVMELPS